MSSDLYILKNGILGSDANTIFFVDSEGNRFVKPINSIDSIFCFGSVTISGYLINAVLKRNICVHFFSKYGTYKGSLMNQPIYDGKVIKNQVLISENEPARVKYGTQIVKSMKSGFISFFKKYDTTGIFFNSVANTIIGADNINQLMGQESSLWKIAYSFLKNEFSEFSERNFHPPKDKVNAVISFLNSLLYSHFLSLCREVCVLPELGFIHASNYKRYSLVLDFADEFKPFLTINLVYYLFKNNKLDETCFQEESEGIYLNDLGGVIVIEEFRNSLEKTFYFDELKRKISIKTLMKYELEKFKKSLEDESFNFISFKQWEKCM
ncbi:MAG: CRISPR-associated endonuclease Cas1 [Candidatus Woesearchaeota archaeon]